MNSQKTVASNLVIVDSGKGVTINSMGQTGWELESWITDSLIIAESPVSRDCPKENWCLTERPDWSEDADPIPIAHFERVCLNKKGTITPQHLETSKMGAITDDILLPPEEPFGDAVIAGTGYYSNVVFQGFNQERTYCGGGEMHAISLNEMGSDLHPPVVFEDCTFEDTSDHGFIYMFDPPENWITVRQCGSFPCTGPLNTYLQFKRTDFEGETGTASKRNFQVIPNNEALANQFGNDCDFVRPWNGYYCDISIDFGVLHFESQDDDAGKRNIYPVYVSEVLDEYGLQISTENVNKLNQYREHTCDGIYPGLFRLGRFPALVGLNKFYDIRFTGTVPNKLFFKLQSPKDGIRVQIRYDFKNTFAVSLINSSDDPVLMDEVKFDDALRAVPPLTGSYCGENKYNTLENSLQFTISTYCSLLIEPRDAIRATIRMQWTMDEFFAAGGTTNFVDRLAGSLGIHASTIKVVAVYEGSVIVSFEIWAESDGEENNLDQVEEDLERGISEETLDIGVTIISGSVGEVEIDPDYWVYTEESTDPVLEEDISLSPQQEIIVKKTLKEDENSKIAAIIIIAAALVVTVTLLAAAYIVLKNKFASRQEHNVEHAGNVTDSEVSKSEADGELEKQYVPSLAFDGEGKKSARKQKENQDDVIAVSASLKKDPVPGDYQGIKN